MLDVGCERIIECSASGKNLVPGFSSIKAPENFFPLFNSVAVKRADYQNIGIVCINRNGAVSKCPGFGIGLIGGNFGPVAGFGIQFPDTAVGHSRRAGGIAIRNEKGSVGSKDGVCRAVLLRLVGYGLPGISGISTPEKVIAVHERYPGVNG